ncbi:MAG: tRNA (adenosine(37)-N6)-threonylcarbamoyltransferase complex ATPase subunit type 1 TsaE [Candidatus Magasanikbacteria bacterium RIFCSPHIGHO2_01_FULL_33_34]|uniref:tRNA threonylcarbamoyladenosine biosynthesis protein TsaE n=1 Tax=Candidatus Magasanikbacteria bacterium RIFCSPHIGHO2_01_FULL_33_34 TaxID=1798671 RepID=A0A1F6LHJ6_9BACT|nr:MAG: tRNA (adenosine(37)-N6)-threonylcarbamoyltransferase complex ATPase subunit type 1 TsaE [Candidatus Magasanikbacteria bacterium RIFCSPHIGHO2_01_FULL_33_34]OGH65064.1 MAG: tRNA (adenosine(37)-N6)-threonylcarbamoyltransferase complex ATPase subunit type 1 TsaE [Candidatus Magasanikbacteria bacterium RIFCSPHIGHO2_02_FULL_33_17]OGH75392.1 MAG: tRNA (adenosine(37)-N6)-threonylcarbamoyltransferase complex ATPase subunit type 1 TsaE [Candidatus Magasanikbacteria bacterium RIFCSPLOWO2_01_FULL_33_
MEYKTVTSEDMEQVGKQIAKSINGGDVILLYGELGSGKSTLTKGLVKELGVKEIATSPTFALMNVYKAIHPKIKKVVHCDTYRLRDKNDLEDVGITDYLYKPDTLCIIEWPDKVSHLFTGKNNKKISIEYIDSERRKIITE